MFFDMKDAYKRGEVVISYCLTEIMVADGLTKALGPLRFKLMQDLIGLQAPTETSAQDSSDLPSLREVLTYSSASSNWATLTLYSSNALPIFLSTRQNICTLAIFKRFLTC